jgi:hypothetical protein
MCPRFRRGCDYGGRPTGVMFVCCEFKEGFIMGWGFHFDKTNVFEY